LRFRSGQKAWVDVEVTARTRCTKMSVTLYVLDDKLREIFDTSTDLLGQGDFDLNAGDVYRCTFELSLNFAGGTYHPSVLVYRRDIQTGYDRWEPATTIYVSSEGSVHGVVQCFPRVTRQEILRTSDASLPGFAGEPVSPTKHGFDEST
jgi:Wzt C-terminal domain